MNWRELQALNNEKMESGVGEYTGDDEVELYDTKGYNPGFSYGKPKKKTQAELKEEARQARMSELQSIVDRTPRRLDYDYDEVLESGYGTSKRDLDVPYSTWRQNPVDALANSQSNAAKIANGFAKMGAVTLTTFADNTLGLIAGVAGLGVDALDGDGFSLRTSFRENLGFGEWMQSIRDKSEELFPNYRSSEEIADADQWWKHMNANFWGDTFLKNFGFSIGAGLSFGVFSRIPMKIQAKTISNGYKAAVAAAAGDGEAEMAIRNVLQGAKMSNPGKYIKQLERTQAAFNRVNWEGMLIGGIGSALGESRTEALMGAREFRDDIKFRAAQEYNDGKDALYDMLTSDDRYSVNINGNIMLTPKGQEIWEIKTKELQDKYNATLAQAENEAVDVANSIFSLNFPLLVADNVFMFGRMAAGGFSTQARALARTRNGMYKGVGSVGRGVARGLAVATSEGVEEVSQKIFSEGSKDVGKYNMAQFHNRQYDEKAMKSTGEWLRSIFGQSATNVLRDPKTWEEFAVGFLTGAIGVPKIGGWSGGMLGEIKASVRGRSDSDLAAEKLNGIIGTPEFRERWRDFVRHESYNNSMSEALVKNDQFAWRNAHDGQLISDVMAFAKAGRLNDLEALVDSFGRVSLSDISDIRDTFQDANDNVMRNQSDQEVLDWLHKRVKEVKGTINEYRSFFNTMNFMANGKMSDDAISEMIYTYSQLKKFEERYSDLAHEVFDGIKPTLREIASEQVNDRYTDDAKFAQSVLASEDKLLRLFGGFVLDTTGTNEASAEVDDMRQANALQIFDSIGAFTSDPSLKTKVEDLQKIIRSRQSYYSRLFHPSAQKSFQEDFTREAKTDEGVAEVLTQNDIKSYVDDSIDKLNKATSLSDYIRISASIEQRGSEYDKALSKELSETSDPVVRKYEDILNGAKSFLDDVANDINSAWARNPDKSDVFERIKPVVNGFNDNDISDMPDDANVGEFVARKIIDKLADDDEAVDIMVPILQDLLRDTEFAKSLGKRPVVTGGRQDGEEDNGEGGGEGNGEGGGQGNGGQGSISSFDHFRELIDNITDYYSDALSRFVDGDFGQDDGLTDKERSDLQSYALSKLNELKVKAGLSNDPESDDSDRESDNVSPAVREARRRAISLKETTTISGSHIQYYHPGTRDDAMMAKAEDLGLRNGVKRRMIGRTAAMKNTLTWYHDHQVQEFVDSGALAALDTHYRDMGQRLPVYFIANPYVDKANPSANSFAVMLSKPTKISDRSVEIMMAVEMSDDNMSVIRDYYDSGLLSDKSFLEIDGTKYQVIGQVWNPTQKEIDSKGEDKEAYQNIKADVQALWDEVVTNSVRPQYNKDVKDNVAFAEDGKWYVAKVHNPDQSSESGLDLSSGERLSTTVNYIMSGRNETRSLDDLSYRKIELRTSLKDYDSAGGERYFAMPTMKYGTIVGVGGPALNADIKAPLGSLWLATREANGKFSWTHVTIARADEYNFEANKDTEYMRRFYSALNTLFKKADASNITGDVSDKNAAKAVLYDTFHIGDGNLITWSYLGNGDVEVMLSGRSCLSPDDFIDALKEQKARFQVHSDDVRYDDRMRRLIDAGILKSNMRSFIRMGSTFGVNRIINKDADGNHVRPYSAKSTDADVAFDFDDVSGAMSMREYNVDSQGMPNIWLGDIGYMATDDGRVFYMSAGGRRGGEVFNNVAKSQVLGLSEVMRLFNNYVHDRKRIPESELSRYNGNVYIIDRAFEQKGKDGKRKRYQYVQLFSKVINGIEVRMQRFGENTSVEIVWDDALWNDMMEIAKPFYSHSASPTSSGGRFDTSDSAQAEDVEIYNRDFQQRVAEEGGKVIEPKKKERREPGKRRVRDFGNSQTAQEVTRKDENERDKIDCG